MEPIPQRHNIYLYDIHMCNCVYDIYIYYTTVYICIYDDHTLSSSSVVVYRYVGMYLCRDFKRDTFCDVHNKMVLRIDKQILFNKIKKILYRNFNL